MTGTDHRHASAQNESVIDPVCGMTVDPHSAKYRADYHCRTYYFCADSCRVKFIAHPEKYVDARDVEPVVAGAIYTCPMHPQVRQVGPGSCPICGMALEPEITDLQGGPNPER